MSSPDSRNLRFIDVARQQSYLDEDLQWSIHYVVAAMELGWLDVEELREGIAALRIGNDCGWQELIIEGWFDDSNENKLRVRFLNDQAYCKRSNFIAEIDTLLAKTEL